MFIGRDFPAFENQSARILGFDLENLLSAGETITDVTSRLRGDLSVDPDPSVHLPVAPQFNGPQVNQLVSFDDPTNSFTGSVYTLSFNVTTSTGQLLIPWSNFTVIEGYGVTSYNNGTPPASARSLILPAPVLDYTVPTLLGGYAGVDFPTANQSEVLFYGFDFTPALSPGETISSASPYLALFSGADDAVLNDPHAYDDSGLPTITGPIVQQKLAWPGGTALSGNVYVLQLTALTSNGQSLGAKAKINVAKIG